MHTVRSKFANSQIKRLDILEGLSRPFEFRRERDSQKYTFGAIWSKKIDEDVKGNLISTGEETEGNYARKHTKRNFKIRGGYSFVYGLYRGWYREKLDSGGE